MFELVMPDYKNQSNDNPPKFYTIDCTWKRCIISKSTEKVDVLSSRHIQVQKENGMVKITSDSDIEFLPTTGNRIFNFVPGFEAIPLAISKDNCRIEFEVV